MKQRFAGVAALALVAGVLSGAPATAGVTPNTIIKAGTSGLVASTTATFKFKASQKGSTFKCRMDSGSWKKCTSPVSYKKLAQGGHSFAVRASKNGKSDRTPATKSFRVDTVAPQTTIVAGPEPVVDDHTPTFSFTASEPATFSCRFGAAAFAACTSPYTAPEMPDEVYTFQVRARDAAGNIDSTPASRTFEILTPITKDLDTAAAAAAYMLPDDSNIDIAANCASNPSIDCPGGEELPPADQVNITASRGVEEITGQDRYDVTATVGIATLIPIKINYSGTECDLRVTSANGANPTWRLTGSLNFVHPPDSSLWRIETSNVVLSDVDDADFVLSGGYSCSLASSSVGFFKATLVDALEEQFNVALCAARGTAYLGPCPD